MRTVGIIGGLGPQTTAEFYLELGKLYQKNGAPTRPKILIESVPLPLDIEKNAVIYGQDTEKYLPFLTRAATDLEKAGADFLVMPCNSLHIYIENIRDAVSIPVLSIVEETVNYLLGQQVTYSGVISTSITLKSKLFENALANADISHISPSNQQQAAIGRIIHSLVNGEIRRSDREQLIATIDDMRTRGVEHTILACTDLQLLKPEHPIVKIHDTMKIFAKATVREMLG